MNDRYAEQQNSEDGSSFDSDSDYGDEDGSFSNDYESSDSNELQWHDDPDGDPNNQIGKVPRNQGFSPMFNDQNMASPGGQGRGSHLMPIQFAKEHIIKIEEDMKKMHDRHVRLMREMDENYKLIEQET